MSFLPQDVTVPSQDSADNVDWGDVIGNKTDTDSGDSLYANIKTLLEHVHSPQKVYPTLAAAITVAGGAGAWTLGNFVTIVAASTITSVFDIHWIQLSNATADDEYELVLYYGATDIEAGRITFTADSSAQISVVSPAPMQTVKIPANSQIRAKLASSTGSDSVDVKIFYHTY